MLLRKLLGDALRRQRQRQSRTLRDVSADASVSLGYLSEVERGQKEASSELLSSICEALGVNLSEVLREVSDELRGLELAESGLSSLLAMPDDASSLTAHTAAGNADRSADRALAAAEGADTAHEARASGDRVVVAA